MRSNRTTLALTLLLVPHVALAYRPFDGTDAAIADPGIIEIELGPVSYIDLPRGSATELPAATLNAGVADGWETVIDATRTITRSTDEHDAETFEAALLLKRILRQGVLQERTGWSIATEFGVLLPTENADDDYGVTCALIGSREIGQAIVHVNAALAENRDGNAELFGGLIIEGATSWPLRPVAELTFEREGGTDARSMGALLGAIWERGEDLNFDIGLRAVREDHDWSYEGRIGLTWAFALTRK